MRRCLLALLALAIFLPLLAEHILEGALDSDNDNEEGFITQREYGEQLYENPRGVSCKVCHGEEGRGGVLARYEHKGRLEEIEAPDITALDIEVFKKKLAINKGLMPKYYLTDSEIEAIYEYIHVAATDLIEEPQAEEEENENNHSR